MKSAKFTLKLVRSFGLGFEVFDPSLNGLYIEFRIACLMFVMRNRGKRLFVFENYWRNFNVVYSVHA